MRAQLRHGAHGGLEILGRDGAFCVGLGLPDSLRQRLLFILLVKRGSGASVYCLLSFFSSMRIILAARLKPASRFLPSSVSRNFPTPRRAEQSREDRLEAQAKELRHQIMAGALLTHLNF